MRKEGGHVGFNAPCLRVGGGRIIATVCEGVGESKVWCRGADHASKEHPINWTEAKS